MFQVEAIAAIGSAEVSGCRALRLYASTGFVSRGCSGTVPQDSAQDSRSQNLNALRPGPVK